MLRYGMVIGLLAIPSVARADVSFAHDVMPILEKAGCNSGNCHGHERGKGRLKLSLRGYNPSADFAALVQGKPRFADPAELDDSRLLLKPSAQLKHGGGKRFEVDSAFYKTLRQWVAEGAKTDLGTAVKLTRLEVTPAYQIVKQPGLKQPLNVHAHYADGKVRDVTGLAMFELSSEGVVEVTPEGVAHCKEVGETAVFVRFLEHMALSRFVVVRHDAGFAWANPPAHNFIDEHVYTKLKQIQVHPSDLAGDAAFLRRLCLDVIGIPPTVDEVRAFLSDKRPDRRARKIDELLEREAFGDQWAQYWLELSGVTESGDSAGQKGLEILSLWLRDSFHRNRPYDQFVRAVIAGRGSSAEDNPGITFGVHRLPKVEVIPQLFLGIRLECAQCHNHPFDVWKQADYQALGNFFTAIKMKEGPLDTSGREMRVFVAPESSLPWERDKKVALRHLDGSTVEVKATGDRREALADWLFGPAKKRTARALVNRVWGKLLGRGIIDPVDDMRFSNPAANEPLLDALADDFIASKYDFKRVVRTILNSRTYQLSSIPNKSNAHEQLNFSHARLRRLRAEQMLDALSQATGVDEPFRTSAPPGTSAAQAAGTYSFSRFLTLFGRPTTRMSPCECIRSSETTLTQVLHLWNGETVSKKLLAKDGTLDRLLNRKLTDAQMIEELYLLALSRPPTSREQRLAGAYLARPTPRTQNAEDLLWALLNSQEFLFNH